MITRRCVLCNREFETQPMGHPHSAIYCSRLCQKRSKDRRRIRWKEHKGLTKHRDLSKLKTIVLAHYGNGKLACVQCGYSNIEALCIDHINNDGYKNRVNNLYKKLRAQGFPTGYQTLCANCNTIKAHEFIKNHKPIIKRYTSKARKNWYPAVPQSSKFRIEH